MRLPSIGACFVHSGWSRLEAIGTLKRLEEVSGTIRSYCGIHGL